MSADYAVLPVAKIFFNCAASTFTPLKALDSQYIRYVSKFSGCLSPYGTIINLIGCSNSCNVFQVDSCIESCSHGSAGWLSTMCLS